MFNKARAKPTHKNYGFSGAQFFDNKPKVVREYFDPGIGAMVKVFEARHAVH
jgi:hypothetical protein